MLFKPYLKFEKIYYDAQPQIDKISECILTLGAPTRVLGDSLQNLKKRL